MEYEMMDDGAWAQQEMDEQRRWEEENDVQILFDNDPGYQDWADELDVIDELVQIEDERNFNVLTVWD